MVIDSGAVPLFVELLSNPVADVKEQVRENISRHEAFGEHDTPAL
jgi:hypothetical protein